jgi:poly-gamma-glutamate synthesis protein (capsule biosynthesis protein)
LLPFDALNIRYRILHIDDIHPLDRNLRNYQFAFNSNTPNYFPDRLTRLLLSGVTALTRDTLRALDNNGVAWAGEEIAPYVNTADFFHTSNEVSFHPSCPQWVPDAVGAFCSRPEHFELLTDLGLDIVELSGNHNNDYGYDAYRETLAWYRENGIWTVGGGETVAEARAPLVLLHNGNDIAMISCNWVGPYYAWVNEDPNLTGGVRPGAANCDPAWLEETLSQLSQQYDVVVVTVQYQEADQYTPTASQQYDFRRLVAWGADMVVGTSSHYPQTYEFYSSDGNNEALIHYGLGNLFFDQTWFAGVRFFMDQLFVYDGELLTIDIYTGIIAGQGRPRPMNANERENFLFLMMVEQGGF